MNLYDRLGNQINPKEYVVMALSDHNVVCQVEKIQEPSLLSAGPGKEGLQLGGMLVVMSLHQIPIAPNQRQVTNVIVCKTPPVPSKLSQA